MLSNNVIEYFTDPSKALKDMGNLLKPDEIIILAIPNSSSPNRLILRSKWLGYSPLEHIWIPSLIGMRELLKTCNLDLINHRNKSCCGSDYDWFIPKSTIIATIYYKLIMPVFEYLGLGDQSFFIISKNNIHKLK